MAFENTEIAGLIAEIQNLSKANANSITTGSGLNFLPLEAEARNTYSVFHRVLDLIPRVTPTELGHEIGGLQTTWDQIITPGTNVLPSIAEGSRSQYINIPTRRTSANYVTLGTDASVTFEAQSAGVGHNDNLGTARLASLNVLLNLEERMAIFGNSGTGYSGQNGFTLTTAQPPAPGIALASSGSMGYVKTVSVVVVPLTGWGIYNALTFGAGKGIVQTVSYTSVDGTALVNQGGTGIPSAQSAVVSTSSDHQSVTVTVQPIPGAFGYACYVDSDDASSSPPVPTDCYFQGVYPTSTFTVTTLPNKATAQKLSALGDSLDHSANPPVPGTTTGDFDGLATWAAGSLATTTPAYVVDAAGAILHADGSGGVVELETAIATQWKLFQTTPDIALISSDIMPPFQNRMQTSPSGSGSTLWTRSGDPNSPSAGGSLIENYKCKFSAYGTAKVIPLVTVPWLPFGTIMAPTFTNPYPAAGNTIPANARMMCREPYYALKYPYVTRLHSQGVYLEEALEVYVPWANIVITSVGVA